MSLETFIENLPYHDEPRSLSEITEKFPDVSVEEIIEELEGSQYVVDRVANTFDVSMDLFSEFFQVYTKCKLGRSEWEPLLRCGSALDMIPLLPYFEPGSWHVLFDMQPYEAEIMKHILDSQVARFFFEEGTGFLCYKNVSESLVIEAENAMYSFVEKHGGNIARIRGAALDVITTCLYGPETVLEALTPMNL
jgi:hypothetical protein